MAAKSKLKYRPDPISRLARYDRLPPPMRDDPPRDWQTWEERCIAVYHWMIADKHGVVPLPKRRGLWFYADAAITSTQRPGE